MDRLHRAGCRRADKAQDKTPADGGQNGRNKMIKNHLSSDGRFLLSFAMLLMVLLLSGCCTFCDKEKFCGEPEPCTEVPDCDDCVCGKHVVYAFDIPKSVADCPTGYDFHDESVDNPEHDGGAGIVERDGGAGIVERESGDTVVKYCMKPCPPGEQLADPTKPREMDWNPENKVVTALQQCELIPVPAQEPDE